MTIRDDPWRANGKRVGSHAARCAASEARSKTTKPVVLVVERNAASRKRIATAARSLAMSVRTYASLDALLRESEFPSIGCVIISLRFKDVNVTSVRDALLRHDAYLPLLFVGSSRLFEVAVRVARAGAAGVLATPIDTAQLAFQMQCAVSLSQRARTDELRRFALRARLSLLTDREAEILGMVMSGKTSRAIAAEVERSAKTIELHRTRILHKLGARNVVELVRDLTWIEIEEERATDSTLGPRVPSRVSRTARRPHR